MSVTRQIKKLNDVHARAMANVYNHDVQHMLQANADNQPTQSQPIKNSKKTSYNNKAMQLITFYKAHWT
ncbi:Uncharacterised protein [Candidatus Bartonella washoeensis]|uniref:Uncharacterized protein n=2 Tax=Candidatus Bartonella washoeensis TaxID=186739 RepID=J0QMG9_9HYPH|nr:hypothetical protein [Bartonella washoeensis]EJF78834.1 hypothetical protein MCQ_01213 [Bartonella washoeensis Sb944nv]EJF86856.1 hypothetical protein MCW_00079 [Bartonella washoeensis 085-0475]SPU27317.1 Uncharacterised protein [Bartonella washoeensis]